MSDALYDVFISAKSEDYPHATIAAKYLADAGLRVFFSQQELVQMGNSDYYSAIDDALEVSRHMLVVTSSRANVTSPWVRKEWQTFLNEKLSGRKTGNVVSLLCGGMTIGDLPLSLRQHEARSSNDLASLFNYFKPPAAAKPQPAPATFEVYICHSSKDEAMADAACERLESRGLRCWIAPRNVPPGVTKVDAIVAAIRGARVMVLVLSANANASPNVRREVETAANFGVKVIPLRIENVQPERDLAYFLGSTPMVDAFTPPLERPLDQLAQAAYAALAPPGQPAAVLPEVEEAVDEPATPPVPVILEPPAATAKPVRSRKSCAVTITVVMAVALLACGLRFALFDEGSKGTSVTTSAPMSTPASIPTTAPAPPQPANGNPIQPKIPATRVVELLEAKKYDELRTYFSPNVTSHLTDEMMETGWSTYNAKIGTARGWKLIKDSTSGNVETQVVLRLGNQGEMYIYVTYDSNGEIAGLWITQAPPNP